MSLDDFLRLGVTVGIGTHLFDAGSIKAFARKYDPQPFHLDEDAARRSVLGGLCASGWHTAAVWMKLNVAARGSWDGPGPGPDSVPRRLQEHEMAKNPLCGKPLPFRAPRSRSGRRLAAGLAVLTMRAAGIDSAGDLVIEFESTVLLDAP